MIPGCQKHRPQNVEKHRIRVAGRRVNSIIADRSSFTVRTGTSEVHDGKRTKRAEVTKGGLLGDRGYALVDSPDGKDCKRREPTEVLFLLIAVTPASLDSRKRSYMTSLHCGTARTYSFNLWIIDACCNISSADAPADSRVVVFSVVICSR
jgi:hypothetical protein